jgi:hypothetical protein
LNFSSPALHLFLFGVFSALLGWPLLTIADEGRGAAFFWSLMAVWGLAILLLVLISRSLKPPSGRVPPGRGEDGPGNG